MPYSLFTSTLLKLQNTVITQQDCLTYLENEITDKLILLDVPYIGSEDTCSVSAYKYQPFHKKVADCLQNAEYPFLYYCRSTPPKSDKTFNEADGKHIMNNQLAQILTIQFLFWMSLSVPRWQISPKVSKLIYMDYITFGESHSD